jgi:hypothetical protein
MKSVERDCKFTFAFLKTCVFAQTKFKEKENKVKILNKKVMILLSMLLMLSMAASMALSPETLGQVYPAPGSKVQSYAFLNIAPNPVGVGQTVTLDMYLASPLLTSEDPVNFTIVETTPSGTTTTLGPFTGDSTGGTFTTIVPSTTGNYTFQLFYGGQTLTGIVTSTAVNFGFLKGVIELPSHSAVETLVVQQTPISRSAYPITPLPTSWWQTPVSAENVQNWYAITGPWLGYGQVVFANTGGYNATGNYNPYTEDVLSGHVLWTKVWCSGGVAGGQAGGTELSQYWSTSQYWPKFAPVIMNGIMYSTWYTETTGYSAGIVAWNLYNGQTEFIINTTNPLECGMVTQWKTPNMYGCIGPYIWTTGPLPGVYTAPFTTEWNMYSALTGEYVLSVVNGTSPDIITTDANGDMIGYYINSTVGTMTTYGSAPAFGIQPVTGKVSITATSPVLVCWNMSQAICDNWGWEPAQYSVVEFGLGVMWAEPLPSKTDTGAPIDNGAFNNPTLAINGVTDGAVVMTAGYTFGQGFGNEQNGWLLVAAMDANTGAILFAKNFTYADVPALVPFTRLIQTNPQNGLLILGNEGVNWQTSAINVRTGAIAWTHTLAGYNGATPNIYDNFGICAINGPGVTIIYGLGGDIWCINDTNGNQLWYTNTTTLIGNPGIETPYGIWPLWVFADTCVSNNVAYLAVGHEYNPPLFHGAQLLALNLTNGKLIWSELDFSVESTSISYGIILSRNCYDNQIYAFGKGPSETTVTAPDIGVTTATPITITGTVMDISPGTKQQAVALNFPLGVPCVSDASESHFMEYVYQQQPVPADVTGVPVTLTETDHNGNTYTIGTTTSDSSGTWAYTWTPPIPGNYTIVATFAGSNAYYGSCAETHIYASSPAPTAAPTASPPTGLATTSTVELGIVAIAIIIIIIGAVIVLLLLRKRP